MSTQKSIVWFRQDLRLRDNPALNAAAKAGRILPIYILDDETAGFWQKGAASRVWLHHSLNALNDALDRNLSFYSGKAIDILPALVAQHEVDAVYWNRCYEPWRIARDKAIKQNLNEQTIAVHTFNGSLLWEPWETLKADGTPYRVFTPFYKRGCLNASPPRKQLPKPKKIHLFSDKSADDLAALSLLPKDHQWDKVIKNTWPIGEKAALETLNVFLKNGLNGYKEGRNFPSQDNVSRLSPYLHWGEISANTVWHKARAIGNNDDINHFCSELGWREFSYSLLYHFPDLPRKNFQPKFDAFPWRKNKAALNAWQQGKTGIPIIDAGMRELWQTGYMHNRVRMIVASFLIKNLKINWRDGEKWFWDTLVDADLANNSAAWQWVAGSGADAAPYFRIFNPVTQGEKFDKEGLYIYKYIPELTQLSGKHLFAPWTAPESILTAAGVKLGQTYPRPIVDLKQSREDALAAYQLIKANT